MATVALEVLTGDAVHAFDPALSARVTHLMVLPEQGHCPNPLRLSRALASRLQQNGATIIAQSVRKQSLEFEELLDLLASEPRLFVR